VSLSWCFSYARLVPQYLLHASHMKWSGIVSLLVRDCMWNLKIRRLGRRAPAKSFHHISGERHTACIHEVRTVKATPQHIGCRRASASLVSADLSESIQHNGIARELERHRPGSTVILPQHRPHATRDLESRTTNTIETSPSLDRSLFFLLPPYHLMASHRCRPRHSF
jgi:hypothetical protein